KAPAVHTLLGSLLRYLPAGVHLVVAARTEPALRLARLRGEDALTELRTHDLAFSREEIRTLGEQALGTALPPGVEAALADDTEGWCAGVRLAVRLLEDRPGLAVAEAGPRAAGRRHARQLIVDEVLALQPPAMRDFLLRTAVLERFCPPLCDALGDETGGNGSAEKLLEALVRDELFVVCLDEAGGWYR